MAKSDKIFQDQLILIAEDEPINFMLLEKMLEPTGAGIIWAKNGKEAVEMTRSNPDIRLILMDIRMPEMNGIEATLILRAEFPELPIIAVTAYSLSNEKEACEQAGTTAFITKPVSPKVLVELIKQQIGIK